ncbi:12098_t:CDS:2 [Funneliformis mosseae]|uniref:12098_t:CDS:1 n=1 Tax=Funneliformis mosseae TaxID=27381 RepID=A0A9N9ER27_FUNMO|nr:12098_t:CDS:2 [Funneliformis mosseae]
MAGDSDNVLPIPNPRLLDKLTQTEVKNHFRNQFLGKMIQFDISHYELENFLTQKLLGRDLLYVTFEEIRSFGISYGSAKRLCEEITRLKQLFQNC